MDAQNDSLPESTRYRLVTTNIVHERFRIIARRYSASYSRTNRCLKRGKVAADVVPSLVTNIILSYGAPPEQSGEKNSASTAIIVHNTIDSTEEEKILTLYSVNSPPRNIPFGITLANP